MAAISKWEHVPHQADFGVRGVGATHEQAYKQAALTDE
jgi:SHS2 domain-containing protein